MVNTITRQILKGFLRSYRWCTVVSKRSGLFTRSRSKKRVRLSSLCFIVSVHVVVLVSLFEANKMRELINTLPADVDALLAKLEEKYKDMDMDDGSTTKKKGRERTIQGALAELQL
jgi:hypothetical protein